MPVVEDVEARPRARAAPAWPRCSRRATGVEVMLVTALGRDAGGRAAARAAGRGGRRRVDLGLRRRHPGEGAGARRRPAVVRLDRGGDGRALRPADRGRAPRSRRRRASWSPTTAAASPRSRRPRRARRGDVPVVWDPHPRGPAPVPGRAARDPERGRGRGAPRRRRRDGPQIAARRRRRPRPRGSRAPLAGGRGRGDPRRARRAARRTATARRSSCPRRARAAGDPCGAGDRVRRDRRRPRSPRGALPSEAVQRRGRGRVRVRRGRRSRRRAADRRPGAPTSPSRPRACARGGTVVATGGCFDLLHAGHVATLEAARALGDCLVVCLNSDASVARLKGADRPLVAQDDRAAVLAALECVDAVVVFDEDDPRARAANGCGPTSGPRAATTPSPSCPRPQMLAEWGGRAVVVPYLAGRSTTRLITEALARAAERTLGTVLVTGGSSGLGAAVVAAVAGRRPADRARPRAARRRRSRSSRSTSPTPARPRRPSSAPPSAPAASTPWSPPPAPTRCGDLADVDRRRLGPGRPGQPARHRRGGPGGAAVPRARRSGRVVTVASTLGCRALPDATAYCASKFGVVGFTRALAAELGDRVGVTLLIPGGMQTQFFDDRHEQYKPGPDPLLNDPSDVAEAVLFALRQPAGRRAARAGGDARRRALVAVSRWSARARARATSSPASPRSGRCARAFPRPPARARRAACARAAGRAHRRRRRGRRHRAARPAAARGADVAVNLHGRGPQSHALLRARGAAPLHSVRTTHEPACQYLSS